MGTDKYLEFSKQGVRSREENWKWEGLETCIIPWCLSQERRREDRMDECLHNTNAVQLSQGRSRGMWEEVLL